MSSQYGREFIATEVGGALYGKWTRVKKRVCCPEWQNSFEEFAEWALNNYFVPGASLIKIAKNDVYCPTNCYWSFGNNSKPAYKASEFCASWNKTVNRIRKHYGMKPFDVIEEDFSEKTCKDCVHYKVCKYKCADAPVCDDYLD